MNLDKTKANIAEDLSFKSNTHCLRIAAAGIAVFLGVADIVLSRFFHEGPWEVEPLFLIVLGMGILFTKTIIELLKALLPWKK